MTRDQLKTNKILRGPALELFSPYSRVEKASGVAVPLKEYLEDLASLVAVEGETARLLPVAERARALFGEDDDVMKPQGRRRAKSGGQMDLFAATAGAESLAEAMSGQSTINSRPSTFSVLDRVHQSMILFAAGRSEALKRFLVEDLPAGQAGAAGNDARFWTLAQALSALYPASTDEKRWGDGVLARKKGLGF